jgi:hypothetical protein
VQVVSAGHALYTVTISDFGEFLRLLGPAPKSLGLSAFFGGIIGVSGKFYDDPIYFSHPLACIRIPSARILYLPNLCLYQDTVYPHDLLVHGIRAPIGKHRVFRSRAANDLSSRVRGAVGMAFDNRLVCHRCKRLHDHRNPRRKSY